jgi:uncharacterized membrane protein
MNKWVKTGIVISGTSVASAVIRAYIENSTLSFLVGVILGSLAMMFCIKKYDLF